MVASARQLSVTSQLGSFSADVEPYCFFIFAVALSEVSGYTAADSKPVSPLSIDLPIKNLQPARLQLQQYTSMLTFYI